MNIIGSPCKICSKATRKIFQAKILNKYDAFYVFCNHCGFLGVENAFWINEAYANPINEEDTGYVSRNLILARKTFLFLIKFFNKSDSFLDYAGGYGMFVRLMRDMGLNFYWDDKYTKNLFARGFEYEKSQPSVVTCFECFEHFLNPLEEIEKMLSISNNIFFSTSLYESYGKGEIPDMSWSYYGFSHGQHISFYSLKTLQYLADKYDLNLYSNGRDLHFLSRRKINRLKFRIVLRFGILPWDMLSRLILKSKTAEDSLSAAQKKDKNAE